MDTSSIRVISVKEISGKTKSNPENPNRDASLWNWLHIFSILGAFTFFCGFPFFFIPRDNTIFYPEYWYDPIYRGLPFITLIAACNTPFNCSVFLKEDRLRSIPIILKMYAWNMMNWTGAYTACYIVWVLILERNHPMPLLLVPCQFYAWVTILYGIWILFPRDLMNGNEFRNKMKTYILYSSWWLVMHIQKDIITFIFANRSVYIEWMFAILLPFVKEGNC